MKSEPERADGPGKYRNAPVRSNNKIFLAGRTVRIEWNDPDEAPGNYLVLFANDGWLRLESVEAGKEFLTPVANVWRIVDIHEKA